jgi:2-dehydro-3-deoxygluconokinase
MTEQNPRVVCIGEAQLELTRGADGTFAPAGAGDGFNTAVYLARAGLDVGFATAVGDDPYSDSIVALASAEGLAGNLILRVPGRLPALCLIERGRSGERVSRIWADSAPARELFELPDWMRIAESLVAARLIYFSGITLSVCCARGRATARRQGRFRRQFSPLGLEGKPGAHAYCLYGSAQTGRYRAADLR